LEEVLEAAQLQMLCCDWKDCFTLLDDIVQTLLSLSPA
jgi:hypothetical protein